MAEPFTLSDYLQGRRNPLLDQFWSIPPSMQNSLMGPDTPSEASVGVYGKGSVQSIPPPARHPLDSLARMVGEPAYDLAMRHQNEFRRTGQMPPEPSFAELMHVLPFGPFGSVRAPGGPPRVPNLPARGAVNAEPVEGAMRWENRRGVIDRSRIQQHRDAGRWPDWGDEFPQRALAHADEAAAREAWDAIVNPIMYPNGLRAMGRWEAERLAMETHPHLGEAFQRARRAWLETDLGRPLTPGEMVWNGLDRPIGSPPPSGQEILNTTGREVFLTPLNSPPRLR